MNEKNNCSILLHIYKKALKMQKQPSILCHHCVLCLVLLKAIHSCLSFLTKTHCISVK